MRLTTALAVPFCAVALVGIGVGPAGANPGIAGAHGQVERGPAHANSICSFSGLNDVPLDPEEGGRVQSYGQIIRWTGALKTETGRAIPGAECNGHLMPYREAFPPPAP
jgi:hypothetical protein